MSAEKTSPSKQTIEIYTDGACSGNPGPAGAGIVLLCGSHRKEISYPLGKATNNIAELTAIKVALESVKRKDWPVRIYTDSQYSLGILSGAYKAKKNRELIEEIKKALGEFPDLKILKVPAHRGVEENERADELAREAANQALLS